MIQIGFSLLLFLLLCYPFGMYVYHISTHQKTWVDPVCDRMDHLIYKVTRVNTADMGWKRYACTLLLVNACLAICAYALLRMQALPIFNPNHTSAMDASLSFHTVISFMTNTNLQHYAGESGLSYMSQMLVITMMMFTSAASGYAACVAMVRGLCGKPMGNYYVDVIRIITRFLLPLSIVVGLFLVYQGVPQNLHQNLSVTTLSGKLQDIASGPMAALESIKHLGTNGGGFLGAGSATPLENPTILSNLIEMLSMMILPAACVFTFGHMAYDRHKQQQVSKADSDVITAKQKRIWIGKEGRTIFVAMAILFVLSLSVCVVGERGGNTAIAREGITQQAGNMEGKEVRFGVDQSALFTTVSTSFTTGSVNNMHDSLTPMGGMAAMLGMMLNCVFGGAGVGLMNMLVYVLIAVFICGLMIGRSPVYLGRKIEGKQMRLAALCIILHPLLIVGFSAVAMSLQAGVAGISNPGFHGLSQVLYEFTSAASNNGSGFEGLMDNSMFWNITTGIVMFIGRYVPMMMQLAIAGSMCRKQEVSENVGSLKTSTISFAIILVVVVYIFAALTFLPALALGPVSEGLSAGV